MVTTRSKDKLANGGPSYPDGADHHHHIAHDSQPDKKRRRVSKSSRSITTAQESSETLGGKPEGPVQSVLDAIPLDVIFEIFTFLHPLDLVRLTLTSKSIRNILMSAASVSIWKSARLRINPSTPDCPPDQTEPRWAILLYETSCMICGATAFTHVQWNLRLRGCRACLDKVLINQSNVIKKFPKIKTLIQPPKVSSQLPQFESLNRRRRAGQNFPQAADLDEILSLLPSSRRTEGRSGGPWYHRASIKKIVATLVAFQEEARSGTQGAKERLDAFKEARAQEALAIMNPEPALKQWITPTQNKARRGRTKCGPHNYRHRHHAFPSQPLVAGNGSHAPAS